MRNNIDDLFADIGEGRERDILEREERCEKAMKAVTKAIVMRLVICGLLIWSAFQAPMEIWVIGLLLLVMIINLSGILPLASELKKRRQEWKELLKEETP